MVEHPEQNTNIGVKLARICRSWLPMPTKGRCQGNPKTGELKHMKLEVSDFVGG